MAKYDKYEVSASTDLTDATVEISLSILFEEGDNEPEIIQRISDEVVLEAMRINNFDSKKATVKAM